MNVPTTTPQGPQRTLMPVSSVFADEPMEDLGEGIRTALAQLSINTNVFGINHHGNYEGLPPQQARQLELVIVKSAKTQSKAFWPGGYNPQSKTPPTCWSSNSMTPDQSVPTDQVQNKTCAGCINDAFVTNPNGLKQKPCGDHKRLAIVPASDMANEAYGGCMIFRIPAGSLSNLDKYGHELKKFGIQYFAYTTWVSLTVSQKGTTQLVFEPGRPLTDEEATIIKELRKDEKSGRIVNEVLLGYEGEDDPSTSSGQATPTQAPQAAAPVQQVKSVAPKPVALTPTMRPAEVIATRAEPKQANPTALNPIIPVSRPVVQQPAQTIAAAIVQPTAPPPSQRTVITEPPVEETEGQIPDEMNDMFGDLMNR